MAANGSDGTPCPYGSAKDDAERCLAEEEADDFVKGAVSAIQASQAGGQYGGGLIPAIVITNHGKTGGYVSQQPYNHYSLLATVEEVGLGYLGNASDRQ